MDNFSQNPERRQVQDISAVNRYLTKMYGFMLIAVLVSALTAYLTMTVFKTAVLGIMSNNATFWIILIVPFVLCMGISFKAAKNPALGFILLMLLSIVYGFEFSMLAAFFTGSTIASAFVSAAGIFAGMAIFGTITKRDLSNWGSYLGAMMIGFLVAWFVNLFLHNPAVTYIFSFIGVIIFTFWTAYDANSAKRIYLNFGSQVSENGLAIMGALNMYLDFINIFMFLLQIFGMSDNR